MNMPKRKSKIFFVHLDVLESDVLVSVGATGKQVVRYLLDI